MSPEEGRSGIIESSQMSEISSRSPPSSFHQESQVNEELISELTDLKEQLGTVTSPPLDDDQHPNEVVVTRKSNATQLHVNNQTTISSTPTGKDPPPRLSLDVSVVEGDLSTAVRNEICLASPIDFRKRAMTQVIIDSFKSFCKNFKLRGLLQLEGYGKVEIGPDDFQ
jgi:hypothetical protein